MKLLFSLTYYSPYVSGLTLYVKRLGEALVKGGYKISILCFQHQKSLITQENVNNVKVVRAKPLCKFSKGFLSIDWFIKSWQEVRKNDVVIINLPQFEGIIPAIIGKIYRKKVISVYHCEVVLPPGILNKFINWLLNVSNYMSLWLSDDIITYTKDFAENSKLLPHFRTKLQFIYPPILPQKIDKRIQKILMGRTGRKSQFTIGVSARLAAEKGVEYLLESISAINSKLETRNSKIKIIIAGSMAPVGERQYRDKILKLAEKYKDYVVFLGELKEEDMGSFYSLIDLLVLPSINSTEAFGMVQVEAMMMGVPVVATDLPGVRIPIQKTGMGKIVPLRDSQALADAIIEVISNRKKYIKAKELIQKEFAIEKTIKFYKDLLDKI